MTFENIKVKYGMNIKQLSDKFNIPYRTIQKWNTGERSCPQYILEMMDRILELEGVEK